MASRVRESPIPTCFLTRTKDEGKQLGQQPQSKEADGARPVEHRQCIRVGCCHAHLLQSRACRTGNRADHTPRHQPAAAVRLALLAVTQSTACTSWSVKP